MGFLDIAGAGVPEYSQATSELIDEEIKEIVTTQYKKALEVLRSNRPVLEKAAVVLLKQEKIEGEDLQAIMDQVSAGEDQQ